MAPRTRSALRDTTTKTVISSKDAQAAPNKRGTRSTRQNAKPKNAIALTKGVSKSKAKVPAAKAVAKAKGPAKDAVALAKTQRSLRSENPGMVLRDITAHILAPPTPRKPRVSAATTVPRRSPSQSAASNFDQAMQPPIPMPSFTPSPTKTQHARRVSPLPPSSPPSTSSHVQAIDSSPRRQDHQSHYPYPNIESIMSDPYVFSDADGHPDIPPDDPFGFFAAEQKLKAARQRAGPSVVATKGKGREQASQSEFVTPIPMGPPPRTRAKRMLDFDEGDGEHGEESTLDTPSPVKISQGIMAAAEAAEKGKGKGPVERPKKRVKRQQDDSLGSDPAEIARKLEARLPRRPKRKHAPAIVESDGEDDEEENVHPNTNRRIRSKYVAKPSSKAQGKSKVKAENADADEEEERRLQERQARLEYFRKLDGYKVSTENVYVV